MTQRAAALLALVLVLSTQVWGVSYCPAPRFDTSKHHFLQSTTPSPRPAMWDWIDPALLLAALCAASWMAHKKRDRRWIAGLMLFSLLYFGFWRRGCVCPVGSIGNIALAAADSSYVIPFVVVAFFLLPLLFTLLFGRSFCGAVCPLGAVQDLFMIKPVRVPPAIEAGLRIFAYLYLAAAVLLAATGMLFIICQYDPFVTLFRFNGLWIGWVLLAGFLALSVFIARPYCRFVCPYGVILRNVSRISKWRVKITKEECIRCRLCENACPFGAISKPAKELPATEYKKNKRRFLLFAGLGPLLAAGGGMLGAALFPVIADQTGMDDPVLPMGRTVASAAGIFLGIVVACKLVQTVIFRRREEYEINHADCMACGRCFAYCPIEIKKRKTAADGVH